tara:strand:- start:306 stop:539 length:234 start_codon:yes stop_codon:yes gene_type:complete
LEKVIFTKDGSTPFNELDTRNMTSVENETIYLEDTSLKGEIDALNGFICKTCEGHKIFDNLKQLKAHMSKEHNLLFW